MKYRPVPPTLLVRRFVLFVNRRGLWGAILEATERFFRYLRKHGFIRTLRHFSRKAQAPAPLADATQGRPHPFDLHHGTDTGGYISGAVFSAVSLSSFYTTAYLGIAPTALTQALSSLAIRYEEFTFVDIGCGKGRALFVAAEFAFRRLLGVEIVGELCDIARANIATNPRWSARISILNQDATRVTFPDGPLFLYLYHPFLAPVLRRVLKNLERQLRRAPRPVYLLYALNPRFTEVMSSFAFLRELSEMAFPLSPEEAAFDPFERTKESFTLYCADFTR